MDIGQRFSENPFFIKVLPEILFKLEILKNIQQNNPYLMVLLSNTIKYNNIAPNTKPVFKIQGWQPLHCARIKKKLDSLTFIWHRNH